MKFLRPESSLHLVTFFQAIGLAVALLSGPPSSAGKLMLQQDQFVSETFESAEQKSFSYLGAHLNTQPDETAERGYRTDLEGRFAPATPVMSYLNVRELYIHQSALQAQFSVGRKKIDWSKLDTIWHLGRFEPLFKWNPLAPEAQGLTGFFVQSGNDSWGFDLFASFMFIPDQGPGYELKDGNFKKTSPWFQTPPSYVRIFDQIDRVNYEIREPSVNDVVFNRSFAGSVHFGKKDQGMLFQGALASKPSNQLALGFQAGHTTKGIAQVEVTPKVLYHDMASAEVSYNSKMVGVGLTGLVETFYEPDFKPETIYNQYSPASTVSPFVEFKLRGWKTLVSYMKVQGGESEVKGPLQGKNQISISEAYPFREVGLLRVSKTQNLGRKRAVDFETEYMRGAGQLFSILNLEVGYKWDADWRVNLQGHLVSAADNPEADKTVAGQFQNNDTVGLGLSYVF
jgi:hypothetical protein